MVRRLSIILSVVLLASIPIVVQGARGAWKLTDTSATQGSIHFDGTFTGVGTTDVDIDLDATGVPVVTCTNQGGNEAPGQNPSAVFADGSGGLGALSKSGKAALSAFAENPDDPSWDLGGCPSSNWTAHIEGVLWDSLTLTVTDRKTQDVLFTQTCILESTVITPGSPITIVSCQRQ